MKKIVSICMFAVMLLAGMVACNNNVPTAEEVKQKIDAQETLSQADYTAILEYCAEYAKKAQPLYDVINAQPSDSTAQAIDATSDLANLIGEYKYLDMFRGVVYNLSPNDLDEKNQKIVQDNAKYQGFPLPAGSATELANPEVQGMIEDMPDSSTGQVISTGDGEAVDQNIK